MPVLRASSRKPLIYFVLIALFIYCFDSLVPRLPSIQQELDSDQLLSAAILFDFIIVVPLLYYWLVVRRQPRTNTTTMPRIARAMPIAVVGAVVAWLALPKYMHDSIWIMELTLLPIEAIFLGYELRMAITIYRKLRLHQAQSGQSLPDALAAVLGPGKLNGLIRNDLSILYYLLGSWRASRQPSSTVRSFTYHRKTGLFVMAALITKILLFEALFDHLVVRMWSETLAWVMTLGSVWVLALLWADCRRSVLEPTRLTDNALQIRHGLRLNADIHYSFIADVQTGIELRPPKHERRVSAEPILGTANVRITLNEPSTVEGLLFQPRLVSFIYLTLDEPDAFARDLRERIREMETS
ncbi:hypothetical protein [Paenibacillus xylaniclasticus]|uniref:hypothetical protein n=1 Tax=Paenibacillus xylaniclasticus TaxID=588083 RepID=UPI000FD7BAC8|nr:MULTISPECIES: hypothetical protein [Paenibacillus]GFN32112.1 hypothetical protein PCURB6_23720 [Paenibacillus curdlanolyticus]